MNYLWVILIITGLLFAGMIILPVKKPKLTATLTGVAIIVAVIGGILVYGYGYSYVIDKPVIATLKSFLAVWGMFLAENDIETISVAPGMDNGFVVFVVLFLHACALFATASAVLETIGARFIKRVRMLFAKRDDLVIIYGKSNSILEFGKECSRRKNTSVVFVADTPGPSFVKAVEDMDCIVQSDDIALKPGIAFCKQYGIKNNKRKIFLYALDYDASKNMSYSIRFKEALKSRNVPLECTYVTLLGPEEQNYILQGNVKQYGFGSVTMVEPEDIVARLMIKKCPPWDEMTFDENGRANTDFDALIIGFGQQGQAVLKSLIMNGQFEGSRFHVGVIAPDCIDISGYIERECPGIFENYSIEMINADGRSKEVFDYLEEHKDTIKYIAICVGDVKVSEEISINIRKYVHRSSRFIRIVECGKNGLKYYDTKKEYTVESPIYCAETLDPEIMDIRAMILNNKYTSDHKNSLWTDWKNCDYFSRKSCRASADFFPAMVAAVHKDIKKVTKSNFNLTKDQLEILGRTEHLRWCAFHYCMGFTTMTKEEYDQREKFYLREKNLNHKTTYSVGKNMERRTHACLIPWNDLDELSARVKGMTGRMVDYKQMDKNNVLEIPEMLKYQAKTN